MKKGLIYIAVLSGLLLFQACQPSGPQKPESKNLVVVTAANFEQEVLKNDQLVMVDFWAPWCAPCRAIAPAVAAIADDYAGKVTVGKVNVDNDGELAKEHKVVNIPNIKFFKGGKVVAVSYTHLTLPTN